MLGYGGLTIISLGSNVVGPWGTPCETLRRAMDEISRYGVRLILVSMLYRTSPYGSIRQDAFLNAAALIETQIPAHPLIRLFKHIEARAGRTSGPRWGPRPLDIDIVDYKRIICNWKMREPVPGKRVILPHAEAHKRAFVLRPLLDIAPGWHHPVFGLTPSQMLKKPGVAASGAILERLECRL